MIYAATHPEDFARNTGQVAGYTSIALAAKRVSLPKVLGNVVQRKVLGAVSANTSTRLVAIARKANVLIRTTDARFRPLAARVLTKGKVWRNGAETVAEAETDKIIAASSRGWTTRLRLRMRGNQTIAEAGTIACFVAGTPVAMADGTLKPIEQVKEGDLVISRDEVTGHTANKSVTATSVKMATVTVALQTENERIECTPEHPFYVQRRGFTAAGKLGRGSSIVASVGPNLTLQQTKQLSYGAKPVLVYNFTVQDFHTYFVGRSKLWVHNDCNWFWKSVKTWGHTFTTHGQGELRNLIGRAASTNKNQGHWLNNEKATAFMKKLAEDGKLDSGDFDLPPGLGQVVKPDGTLEAATRVHIELMNREGYLVRTSYPIL